MMKKTVQINESKNEIRYYEKEKPKDDYLDTILKYMCTSTETSESIKNDYEYKVLRNGKRLKDD
tara:strand:+ start:383 stop:574 length:192 start_codon:yes stop_codon:yes gene_type:complete